MRTRFATGGEGHQLDAASEAIALNFDDMATLPRSDYAIAILGSSGSRLHSSEDSVVEWGHIFLTS